MQTAITVSELTTALKSLLEGSFGEVTLQAEISNFKPHSSGHCYFVLKDAGAQIQAVMFRSKASSLKTLPKEGDLVIAKGQITVYEQRGQYQIIVSEMKPQGLGALLAQLEELKKLYAAKGYFDQARKKALPPFPQRIGVVTSKTGAVIRDIIHVLERRNSGFSLLLNPVKVQGEGAALEIAAAIDQMNQFKLCDVIIVGRGGGSIEDLWAFNEAPVLEAIFRSRIPIISAVGHETDVTLSDLVADIRAPTPSAAAEIVTKESARLFEQVKSLSLRIDSHMHQRLHLLQRSLAHVLKHPFLLSSESFLAKYFMRLDETAMRLDKVMMERLTRAKFAMAKKTALLEQLKPQNKLGIQQKALLRLTLTLDQKMQRTLTTQRQSLEKYKSSFAAMNPKSLLNRGYALLFSERKKALISSAKGLEKGDKVTAEFADGTLHLLVEAQTGVN